MINGDVNYFVEMLSMGCELNFLYKGKEYMVQGWHQRDGLYTIVLETELPDDFPPDQDYMWQKIDTEMEACAEAFLAAPIWDGKTFWEVESEITWTD